MSSSMDNDALAMSSEREYSVPEVDISTVMSPKRWFTVIDRFVSPSQCDMRLPMASSETRVPLIASFEVIPISSKLCWTNSTAELRPSGLVSKNAF